jgi:hypothetical protein
MSSFFVPPGGLSGFSQMTPASRAALVGVRGAVGGQRRRTKRRRVKGSKAARRSGQRSKSSSGRKMKFGSPAWQKKYRVGKFAKKR